LNPSKSNSCFFCRSTAIHALILVAAAASLAAGSPLRAESPPAAAPTADAMEAAKRVHAEYMELESRLDQIQAKALEAKPELKQQRQAFTDLMLAKMPSSSGGGSAKDDLAALEKIEQTLGKTDTPDAERQTLIGEYQQKAMAFRKAQMEALKDAEVQKAQEALMDATLTAMKAQDPETEQLIQQMRQKQEELSQMMGAPRRTH
jgi:hypothetical protein